MFKHTLIAVVAVATLAACANTLPGSHAPAGAMTYAQVNTCVARYFGVEPLRGRPQIAYMAPDKLHAAYGSAYGYAQVSSVEGLPGPVARDVIYLAPGLNVEAHNTVLTHEVIHQYQARTSGAPSPGSHEGETHAQAHHFAWKRCV